MAHNHKKVAVIIAAWNAQATISRAIRSALDQPETTEVIVVDDGSSDATNCIVLDFATKDSRVILLTSDGNRGPAAARNLAIAHSRSDYIAVLDADDFLLPGRFTRMLSFEGWDAIADNIVFVPELDVADFDAARLACFPPDPQILDLASFIRGNISHPSAPRGELGFLKPVIRRAFIDEHRIRYDETLRLGEDFALYVQMLAAGAAFITLKSCGYVAIERANSLSGKHRTEDLANLLAFDRQLQAQSLIRGECEQGLARHAAQLEAKLFHRRILDVKRMRGTYRALADAARKPLAVPGLVSAVLRDKLRQQAPTAKEVRYLF